MHGQHPRLNGVPVSIFRWICRLSHLTGLQYEPWHSRCEVNVVLEVPHEVTRTNPIHAVQELKPSDEVITNCAGDSLLVDSTGVLRGPNRNKGLSCERLTNQQLNNITQVTEFGFQ